MGVGEYGIILSHRLRLGQFQLFTGMAANQNYNNRRNRALEGLNLQNFVAFLVDLCDHVVISNTPTRHTYRKHLQFMVLDRAKMVKSLMGDAKKHFLTLQR